MSTPEDVTFWRYEDPIHDAQIIPATPGVTPGWVVIGDMDQAWSVPFAVLTAPDGSQAMEQTGDAGAVRFVQLIVHIRTITNVHRSGIGGEHGRHDLLLR